MSDPAAWSDRLVAVVRRAEASALRLDSKALAEATLELEALADGPHADRAPALERARAEVQRFGRTCRFLSQTLSDCLDAATGRVGTGSEKRYARGGRMEAARARALVVARYG
jgi:hypothetical protein